MKKLWNTINQKLNEGDNRIYFNIFIAAMLVMCYPLFNNQLFIGHDWTYHMFRMQGLKEGLLTGQFPVRITPLFLNGYGYASSLFYPDLLLYFPVGLQMLGVGIEESYKVFLIFILAATFWTSYYCGKGITRSSYAGIIFALVFSLSQYHLQNIYTRFAVGEVTAFIFLPFILYGLYNLIFENFGKPWLFVAGFSGLMLTHTISLGLASLASVIVALVGIKPILKDPQRIPRLLAAILAVLALTCSYWIPVVEQLSSATFGLPHSQTTWVQVSSVKIPVMFANSYVRRGSMVSIGLSLTLLSLLRIFIDNTSETADQRKTINWTMGFGFFFLFLASDIFPWQLAPSVFNNLSYPLRHYAMASLFLAAAIAVMMDVLFKGEYRMPGLMILVIFICGFGVTVVTNSITTIGDPIDLTPRYYRIARNTDAISGHEWLPSGVNPNAISYAVPVVTSSEGRSIPYTRRGLQFDLSFDSPAQYLDFPLVYYKGYAAVYKDAGGESIFLPVSDEGFNKTVRVSTKDLPPSGTITVDYTGTVLQKVSFFTNIFIIFFGSGLIYVLNRKNKHKQPGGIKVQ